MMISNKDLIQFLSDSNHGMCDFVEKDAMTVACVADASRICDVMQFLKSNSVCEFQSLMDVFGIDFPRKSNRFTVVYNLLSICGNKRLFLHASPADESLYSVASIFPAADWFEREVYDMYGVHFRNHPNLQRILSDYGFEGHPLRKDFPLTGYTEVVYSEEKQAVVRRPVVLDQDYRNFDSLSPWQGPGEDCVTGKTDESTPS